MRFATTILSSFFAAGALLAAAGQALASTPAIIPFGQTQSTINIGSFSESVSLSTKYGAFGAGFDVHDTLTAETNNTLTESVGASSNIQLFGNQITLAGFDIWAKNPGANYVTAGVTETLLGATVALAPLVVTNSSASLTGAVCVSTTDLKLASGKSPGEAQIMVGPIPIYMAVSAAACPQLTFSGSGSYAAGSYSDITFTVTPNFDVSATAQVGIGTSVASVGVKGSLTLLNVSLPVSNTLAYTNALRQMQYSSTGTVDITTLSGSFALYASAGWGPFSVEYDYTLFSWNGWKWSYGVFSDAKPTATDVTLDIQGSSVSTSYQYQGFGAAQGASTYRIQRADTSSGGNVSDVTSSSTYDLTLDPVVKPYLRFCVTPRSVSNVSGDEACSTWVAVGSLAQFWDLANGQGAHKAYAYENADSGHCFDLWSDAFDDKVTSLYFQKPTLKPGNASLVLFQDPGCNGATATVHDTDAPGTLIPLNDIGAVFGSGWDNKVSSFAVYYNEVISAKNLDIAWTGPYARPVYSFSDTAGKAESGTKYRWERSFDQAGTSTATVQPYSTTSQYALTWADQNLFLRLCVLPASGFVTGSETCTRFMPVGNLLSLWRDPQNGGPSLHFPYEHWTSGTCVNLGAYGFDNAMSGYAAGYRPLTSPDGAFYGITFAADPGCNGATMTSGFTGDGYWGVGASYVGDTWNDVASSFKVTYRRIEALGVSVAFAGPRAIPLYQLVDSHNLAESGSTYQWEIADDTGGTNAHVLQAYGTTSAHSIAASEQGKALRVCVKPADGVIVGPESCSTFKKIDADVTQYFGFDGVNDYAQAPSGVWFPGSSFTVMAWVYVDAVTNWARVFDFGNGPSSDNVLLASSIGTTGKPRFSIHKNGAEYPVDSPVALPVGQWTHLAGVFDGTTGHLYINGVEVASGGMPVPNPVTRNNAFIGRSNWSPDAYFKGKLADVRINGLAYSSNEVNLSFSGVDYPTSGHLASERVRYRKLGDAGTANAGKLVDWTGHKLQATYVTP